MTEEMRVGFWRAGHGGYLTVEENRAHDAACDGRGHCTWQREEPHHAAARQPTDEERQAVIDLLRERAKAMRRVEPARMPAERLVGRARSCTGSGGSGAPGGLKRATASDRHPDRSGEAGS